MFWGYDSPGSRSNNSRCISHPDTSAAATQVVQLVVHVFIFLGYGGVLRSSLDPVSRSTLFYELLRRESWISG